MLQYVLPAVIFVCLIVYGSPRRPSPKLSRIEHDVEIDLRVLGLSQHYHRKIHLRALPVWTYRLLNINSICRLTL